MRRITQAQLFVLLEKQKEEAVTREKGTQERPHVLQQSRRGGCIWRGSCPRLEELAAHSAQRAQVADGHSDVKSHVLTKHEGQCQVLFWTYDIPVLKASAGSLSDLETEPPTALTAPASAPCSHGAGLILSDPRPGEKLTQTYTGHGHTVHSDRNHSHMGSKGKGRSATRDQGPCSLLPLTVSASGPVLG